MFYSLRRKLSAFYATWFGVMKFSCDDADGGGFVPSQWKNLTVATG